jgi:hypothetical protein
MVGFFWGGILSNSDCILNRFSKSFQIGTLVHLFSQEIYGNECCYFLSLVNRVNFPNERRSAIANDPIRGLNGVFGALPEKQAGDQSLHGPVVEIGGGPSLTGKPNNGLPADLKRSGRKLCAH